MTQPELYAGIKRKLDGVEGEVKALPRILAEMLAERDRKS
jgi:hypothetical protein